MSDIGQFVRLAESLAKMEELGLIRKTTIEEDIRFHREFPGVEMILGDWVIMKADKFKDQNSK